MIALAAAASFATTVAQVPDPRPKHVVDVAGVLFPGDADRIEDRVARSTGVTTFVVVAPDAIDAHALAVGIYDAWHLGDSDVVLLLVTGSRSMEMWAGADLRGTLTDAWMLDVQQNTMAPYFRKGDWGNGLLAGVDAIDRAEPVSWSFPDMMKGGLMIGGVLAFGLAGQFFGFGRGRHHHHGHHHGHRSHGGGRAGGTGSRF